MSAPIQEIPDPDAESLFRAETSGLFATESAKTQAVLLAMAKRMADAAPTGTRVAGCSVDTQGRLYVDLEASGLPVRQRVTLSPSFTHLVITDMVGTRQLPTSPRNQAIGAHWQRALKAGTPPAE